MLLSERMRTDADNIRKGSFYYITLYRKAQWEKEKIILTKRFLGVKTEPRTARLYHIIPKSSMGEQNKILTFRFLGVKTEPRTAWKNRN